MSVPWTPNLSVVSYLRFIFESSKELGSVSQDKNGLENLNFKIYLKRLNFNFKLENQNLKL